MLRVNKCLSWEPWVRRMLQGTAQGGEGAGDPVESGTPQTLALTSPLVLS